MDTDDDDGGSNLIDRDQSRDLASRAFYYALDSFYFLVSLFKVKQSIWQKELDKDATCLNRLLSTMATHMFTGKQNDGEENERVRILRKFFSFTDILHLIDSTRLCQSLQLFIQLFDDETHQVGPVNLTRARSSFPSPGRTLQNLHDTLPTTSGRVQSRHSFQHGDAAIENHTRARRGDSAQSLPAPFGVR